MTKSAEDETKVSESDPDPRVSIVIPTLNEEEALPLLLKDLQRLQVPHEVIVADCGSNDGTVEIAEKHGALVFETRRGRGHQMRAGAERARSPLLAFFHADVRVPPPARIALEGLTAEPPAGALVFSFRIQSPRTIYRVLERGTRFRGRFLRLPYGDQGLVVLAKNYWGCGGHPEIPIMEDISLNRTLRKEVGLEIIEANVLVSPRRWEEEGPLRRSLKNLTLAGRFIAGVSAERLARSYPAKGERDRDA